MTEDIEKRKNLSIENPEDRRVIFQSYLDDIRHIKSQQWLAAYYIIIFQAAIAGFVNLRLISSIPQCIQLLIYLISIMVVLIASAFGIWLTCNGQKDLTKYRRKKDILLYGKARNYEYYKANCIYKCMFMAVYIFSFLAVLTICIIKIV